MTDSVKPGPRNVEELVRVLGKAMNDMPDDAPAHIDLTFGEARQLRSDLMRFLKDVADYLAKGDSTKPTNEA